MGMPRAERTPRRAWRGPWGWPAPLGRGPERAAIENDARMHAYGSVMSPTEARMRFAAARVARFATAGADGRPHLVPVVFAVDGGRIYTAVDDVKPKTTTRLRRLRNVAENPAVTLLADHYEDDWTALWWARADGVARLVDPGAGEAAHARRLLAARYPQYRDAPPPGVVIAVDVTRWSGWAGAAAPDPPETLA
jgi:PPOX class probable F420-dependent enzyme